MVENQVRRSRQSQLQNYFLQPKKGRKNENTKEIRQKRERKKNENKSELLLLLGEPGDTMPLPKPNEDSRIFSNSSTRVIKSNTKFRNMPTLGS